MKTTAKLILTTIMLITASGLSMSAQGGKRGSSLDTTRIRQQQMRMVHHPDMFNRPDSAMMMDMGGGRFMASERGMGQGNMMQGFMCPCMMRMNGMRHGGQMQGMHRGMQGQPGMGMRQHSPGFGMMNNIPNLTDKQKKDMEELMVKQQEEMQKMREEMQKKMQDVRDSHRNAMMNLLSPEQKKWMDENFPVKNKN